jgi:hypothetical protein
MLALRLNTFIIQVSITIVTYNRQNIFIVQATGDNLSKLFHRCQGTEARLFVFLNIRHQFVNKAWSPPFEGSTSRVPVRVSQGSLTEGEGSVW